jgi:hypothetical protein
VQRIEQGLSQGLVVASFDGFDRSLHGLALIERIERAGGHSGEQKCQPAGR